MVGFMGISAIAKFMPVTKFDHSTVKYKELFVTGFKF